MCKVSPCLRMESIACSPLHACSRGPLPLMLLMSGHQCLLVVRGWCLVGLQIRHASSCQHVL